VLELAVALPPDAGVDSRIVKSRELFRQRVKALVEQRGKTPSAMAQELGHSSSWISQIFSGQRGGFFATIDEIATYLKVSPSALFGGRDEDAELVWTKPDAKALAETKGESNDTGLERGGATMDDDLGQSLLTTLGLVPAEQREAFVTHCFHTAMSWRSKSRHAATGTDDPKA
jgi:transcriptional regulator with XRE-family HTH domain